ncbi:DUF6702 family protein [Microbulbifer sp. 2205BS26-8]|uniref:DUF6702 family protein n=1 Tax=Microbulbifer sp. 2205BS26-8 TaxID=3064386 RepID=UPI00273E03CB|nr:DUF6702 family protein [Microbulbifer sp. 2205BS26-8]MDP5209615.1 hypothetical protein [Microbulbifer sp. 2205BS26-8]
MKQFFPLISVMGLLIFSLHAEAHRYHFGLTEISLNERAQTLEISHRFFVADIEKALSLAASKSLQGAQKQMEGYVNTRFQISDDNGDILHPRWVGMEADVHDIWIYQEVPLADIGSGKLKIRQSMLMEIERDQINTMNFTHNGKTQSYTLKPGNSQVEIAI